MSVHSPDFATFCQLAAAGGIVPVYRRVVSDTLTPVSAYSAAGWQEGAFLFESVVGGEKVGRYSFLGGEPFLRMEAFGHELHVTRNGKTETRTVKDPLIELQKLVQEMGGKVCLPRDKLPRFVGGAVGYAGYDVIRYTENLPNSPSDDRGLPDLSFAFYDQMVVFDHINKTIIIIAQARPTAGADAATLRKCYEKACAEVDALCNRLQQGSGGLAMFDIRLGGNPTLAWKADCTQAEFESAVRKCQEYIHAGDIFQVVISQRLAVETNASSMDIYRALRVVNPSPFMFLLSTAKSTLIGSSPEIMVRVEDGETTIRPLAGTRKRGADAAEDAALAQDLLADPKEIAEHVMLVDLARNDVGRIAEYGTVRLSDVMVVEKYSHVMHITSNVTGQLRPGLTAIDALRAGLPAGTVSGAPKVRAMEIIDEIEHHRRGPYGGAVGYLDYTGNMDTCIALRTIVHCGNTAYVQAGAGIVAESVPASEYQETLSKAAGLLRAIEIAERSLTGE